MNLRKNRILTFVLGLAFALGAGSLTSCSKKGSVQEDTQSIPNAAGADENKDLGDSDAGKAMGLQTIYFAYDSFVLDADAKNTLKSNVAILKDKKSVKIQIEGHCDQRGGIQYNLALGEKRANAVKKLLSDLGVKRDRITTISFGKERPMDSSMSENAYAKNRRAVFVVTSQ